MVPEQKHTPDASRIETHLRHVTGRWGELGQPVMLEVVHLTAEDKARVRDVARFSPDATGLSLAADHIAAMNAHSLNSYIVVNPVDATRPLRPGHRADGSDIVASFFQFADADTAEAADNIRNFVGPKCTFVVVTGTTPHVRPHVYWELDEPTRNLQAWSRIQANIAANLGTDKVIDPPRIMRVAGTINWPKPQKQAKGYVAEVTDIHIHDPDERPPVTSEQMDRAFQPRQTAPAHALQIDTGGEFAPALDRERATIQALSGQDWHNAVIRLVASYVARGLSDAEIHALTDPLTLAGYSVAETREEVQTAIDGARRKGWTPEPQQYAEPNFAAAPKPPEAATAALEWFDDVQPALSSRYLVKGLLDAETMSVVYGPSNSGKTFFALDLAFHIAAGMNWRGMRTTQAGVLYLAAEGGRGVANRIVALREETGAHSIPFALRRAGLDLLKQQADLQAVYDLAMQVKARADGLPMMIVIDTLSRVMAGGDENSASDMTALIRNIDAIRQATGAHVMIIHHSGKDTARGARGHSSLRAATDTEIEVGNEDGNRAAMVTKQRDWQGGETFAFTLKSVQLGTDSDGDEVTSCVVEASDTTDFQAARKAAKGRGKNQQIIMEAFDQMVGEGLARGNPGGVGMPEPGQFWAVDLAELRAVSQGKMAGDNTAKLFRTAWETLTAADGIFCTGNNLAWRVDRRKN